MEMIPLVTENSETHELQLKGFAERKWAESQNLCHLTTLLIPIFPDRSIQIQVRYKIKSFPGCRDIFGGHVELDQEFWPFLLGSPFDLKKIIVTAGAREANEELRIINSKTGYPHILQEKDIHQVGNIGEFKWESSGNFERSTLFLVPIPNNCITYPMDNIEKIFYPVEKESQSFIEINHMFHNHPQYAYKDRVIAKKAGYEKNKANWQFADGAARFLENKNLSEKITQAIDNLPSEVFQSPE